MLLTRSRSLFAPLAVALTLAAGHALAVPIPPGGASTLPGTSGPGGTVIRDTLVPFAIRNAGGTVIMRGTVQDRVVRTSTGALSFEPRIRDVTGSTAFGISRVTRKGLDDFFTDVDWSPTGLGVSAPTSASRSGDGDTLDYYFSFAPVFAGSSSRFFRAATDADQFAVNGRMTLQLENGLSTTIAISAPVIDTTPPDISITSPSPESCVCPGIVDIRGLACDPESDLDYTVRVRRSTDAGGTSWTLVNAASTERCSAGTLASWNTTGLPGGDYIILVEAINQVGLTASAAIEVRLDTAANPAVIRTPEADTIIGGTICLDGSVGGSCFTSYTVNYRSTTGGPFLPVDTSTPVYTRAVTNDPFANWNTRTVADGKYEVRVRVADICGRAANTTNVYEVDNTAPIAEITSVTPCEWITGLVDIKGQVFDKNIGSWVLEYTGGTSRGWTRIASGSGNVSAGDTIAIWDTTTLERCAYTIRLRASDQARVGCVAPSSNSAGDMVSVNVGCEVDLNGDGKLDIFDFLEFSNKFSAGCL